MNAERWQQLKPIFHAALDLPLADREAFLSRICAGDAELQRDVAALLGAEERATDFLSHPAAEYVPGLIEGDPTISAIGHRIGPYEIVREIGAGGMGQVYLAERKDEFHQKVALKLLKRELAYQELIARFRNERQILAALDHPCIARLLDGGATADGQPFFVMEYVDGATIDRYCNSRQVPIPERLKLFRLVCSAVQYAHQSLVVHRDIKPGNILVTGDGTPKLLDFGIAKLLRHDSPRQTVALTEAGVRLMTPEYASPEQVRGLPITTSTDVYSLGIVLFELLSGRLPYQFPRRSAAEIERMICEQESPRPSTLAEPPVSQQLTGDLDTIVLKAIEKEPHRRYQSVEQFSEDIRRHLERMPITARPQTLRYRMGKFVRRNRTAVLAGLLVLLSLSGGLVAFAWEGHVARRERARAERRFQDVRNLAESLLLDVYDKITKGSPTEARQAVVAKALEYLSILEKEAGDNPVLQLNLAEGYLRLGDVQGNPYSSGQSDPSGALVRYDKALRLAQNVVRREPRNAMALGIEARAWKQRSDVLLLLGKNAEAVSSVRKSIDGFEALAAAFPGEVGHREDLARSFEALGDQANPGLSGFADAGRAADAYRKALQIWKEVLSRNPKQPGVHRAVAVLTMKLGDMQWYTGPQDGVRTLYLLALESIAATNMKNADNVGVDSSIRRKLADLDSGSHPAEAAREYRELIASREKLLSEDSRNSRLRIDLVVALLEYGHLQEGLPGGLRHAIASYRRAWDLITPLRQGDPNNVMMQAMAADAGLRLARTLLHAGESEQAGKAASQALEVYRHLVERQGVAGWLYGEYADVLLHVEPRDKRDPVMALKYAQLASDAEQGKNAKYLDLLAQAYFLTGRPKQAAAIEQEALRMLPPTSADKPELERRLKQFAMAADRQHVTNR